MWKRKKYDPSASSPAQKRFVKGICKILKIKFTGDYSQKKDVQEFISQNIMEYRKFMLNNNIPFPPTEKQKRCIRIIQKETGNKFIGKTALEAIEFIKPHYKNKEKDEDSGDFGYNDH